ncbi:solute carrier family 35 member F3-like [Tubulanus polymorphus]|uniref:solute carrier family 35 member F3-like n=1 Tax=Tubulanus polymorphus TaxID=672921 RepID=UPI003DA62019
MSKSSASSNRDIFMMSNFVDFRNGRSPTRFSPAIPAIVTTDADAVSGHTTAAVVGAKPKSQVQKSRTDLLYSRPTSQVSVTKEDGTSEPPLWGSSSAAKYCVTDRIQRCILGGIFMIVIGITLVSSTQFMWLTFIETDCMAPFFIVYFSLSGMVVFYPLSAGARWIYKRGQLSIRDIVQEDMKLFGPADLRLRSKTILFRCSLFTFLWFVSNYLFIRALTIIIPLDVIILYICSPSFVYLLSWIILQKKFLAIRIVAVIFSISGVVLMAYLDGLVPATSMGGVVMAVTGTAGSATIKVLFKRLMGDASNVQLMLFLSCIAVFNIVTMWPLLTILYFTNAEPLNFRNVTFWYYLTGTSVSSIVFVMLTHLGLKYTYQVFINIGLLLAIPFSAIAESIWQKGSTEHGKALEKPMRVSAIVLIVISYVLVMIPDKWHLYALNVVRWKRKDNDSQQQQQHLQQGTISPMPRSRLRSIT